MLNHPNVEIERAVVQSELECILTSRCFRSSKALQKFLHHIVTETLAGRVHNLTQSVIAVQGLGKDSDFDDIDNPLVRIQAGRLRKQLADYYATEGRFNAIRITLPSGSYRPVFTPALPQNTVIPTLLEIDIGTTQDPTIVCIPRSFMAEASSEPFITRFADEYVAALAKFSFCQVTLADPAWQSEMVWQRSHADFALYFDLYPNESGYNIKCSLVQKLNQQIIWGYQFSLGNNYPTPAIISPIVKRIAHDTINYETGVAHSYWARQQLDSAKPIAPQHQALVAVRQYLWNPSAATFRSSWQACTQRLEQTPNDVPALFVYLNHCLAEYGLKYQVIESIEAKVMAAADTLLHLVPDNAYAHSYHAMACLFKGDNEGCYMAATKAQALNALDSYLNIQLGLIYVGLGEWQIGKQFIQDSIDISPIYPNWYHIFLAICHYREGHYLKATQEINKVKLNHVWTSLLRTALYQCNQKLEHGAREYRQLQQKYPDFTQTSRQLIDDFPRQMNRVIQKIWSHLPRSLR